MPAQNLRNRLLLILTAVLFSTGGAAVKAASLTGWQVASFRSGVAAIALLIALPDARRGWSWRVLPVSLAYAGTLILSGLIERDVAEVSQTYGALLGAQPELRTLGEWRCLVFGARA